MLSSVGIKADPPAAFIYQYLATTGPAQSKLSVQASFSCRKAGLSVDDPGHEIPHKPSENHSHPHIATPMTAA
jgi:hypothetical protein